MSDQALLLVDADHVHRYLFETPFLAETRGAAALSDNLNRLITRDIIEHIAGPDSVIYADGGSALAVVPANQVEQIVHRLRLAYRTMTRDGATVTGAAVPLGVGQEQRTFGDAFRQVTIALRAAKQADVSPVTVAGHPLIATCDACGRRPAERRGSGGRHRSVCVACEAKRQEQERDPSTGPWARLAWFAESAGDDVRMLRRVRPHSLNDIASGAGSDGYMGLIACDGNSFGQRLQSFNTRERAAGFAEVTNDLLEDVTFRTMLDTVPVEVINNMPCLPCEPLLLGGDDVLLLAPANLALQLALRLVQRFEQECPGRTGGEKLFLSAAVVLAPATVRIGRLQAIAADLLQSAKRRFQDQGGTTSTVDYWVTRDGIGDLPSRIRTGRLTERKKDETLTLTQRPLTASRLAAILQDVEHLSTHHVPVELLTSIASAATQSRSHASMATRAALSSCTGTQRGALTRALVGQQAADDIPWRRDTNRGPNAYTTPVLDILELLPFVSKAVHAAS